ncbi:ANTAR domain-containing response regulator [Burkholderia sp. L27(2015)]|uniref:ANTAR domain-containing response regulator n=1 Tax=Burkholderia sp. L27(2015) TaxID=1641858 RepID=UPI0020B13860|nr:ANTAR domain-containing protein [Burkholderia sp. L27(2015)]
MSKNASLGTQTLRVTPALLKDLRMLRVAVFHPDDADGTQLVQQLQRIGCQVQAFWPPLPQLPEGVELVFLAVRPDIVALDFAWVSGENSPALIAVVAYENPTIVEAVLRIGAKAILPAPVRSFGLLSALVLARALNAQIGTQSKRIAKLELKLAGQRNVLEATRILSVSRGISDDAAFDLIRNQAMAKRVTKEEIATAIVNANDVLNFAR